MLADRDGHLGAAEPVGREQHVLDGPPGGPRRGCAGRRSRGAAAAPRQAEQAGHRDHRGAQGPDRGLLRRPEGQLAGREHGLQLPGARPRRRGRGRRASSCAARSRSPSRRRSGRRGPPAAPGGSGRRGRRVPRRRPLPTNPVVRSPALPVSEAMPGVSTRVSPCSGADGQSTTSRSTSLRRGTGEVESQRPVVPADGERAHRPSRPCRATRGTDPWRYSVTTRVHSPASVGASRSPARALSSVDLPALTRPTSATRSGPSRRSPPGAQRRRRLGLARVARRGRRPAGRGRRPRSPARHRAARQRGVEPLRLRRQPLHPLQLWR